LINNFDLDIDICGACTLSCPSCPQGNIRDYRLPQGFMEPEVLARIVEKAGAECRNVQISLYNWAEPLLHPRLTELVGIVQAAGIPCHLSSNLSILPDADALMAVNPASLRISNSGFSQKMYGRTHRGGNIEQVKKHMVALAHAKKRTQANTDISVYYHRYRHNLREEPLMREFATGLGFNFHAVWSLMLPLEKVLAYVGEAEVCDFPLTDEDQNLINSLALPLREAMSASRNYESRICSLRDNAISLDFQGNATLCCGVFDARKYTLTNYLDLPLTEIQRLRQNHPLCEICMAQGGHVYMTHGAEEMDGLALSNLASEDVEFLDLRYKILWQRRQERLQKIYQTFFSKMISKKQKAWLKRQFDRMLRISDRIRESKRGKG
jgi:organic radical activating enzyme